MTRARYWLALFALLTLSLVLGCQSIAGIEDRTYDPQSTSQGSTECRRYCETVMKNCTGEFQVYSTIATCLGVCANLDPGTPLEPVGNNVACRANQAALAGNTGEPQVHCPRAGPGGNKTCGSNCENYCGLYAKVCPSEFASNAQCLEKCAALKDVGTFDAIVNHDGDTLQCRLVHVSSSTVTPEEHCPHARLAPTSPCTDPDNTAPECADFCQVVMTACTGDLATYESTAQCLAVCKALPVGRAADRTENTVGCRKYHAYSSLLDPNTHCPHTGPGGDGHCGTAAAPSTGTTGNCESYCTLLKAACSAEFTAAFGDAATCMSSCINITGAAADSHYSVVKGASGNNLECRMLHVARAQQAPSFCSAAVGGAPCR